MRSRWKAGLRKSCRRTRIAEGRDAIPDRAISGTNRNGLAEPVRKTSAVSLSKGTVAERACGWSGLREWRDERSGAVVTRGTGALADSYQRCPDGQEYQCRCGAVHLEALASAMKPHKRGFRRCVRWRRRSIDVHFVAGQAV